jgi:hypothetical protein
LICELWACGTDCIIDVHIADVEAKVNPHQKKQKKEEIALSNLGTFPLS